MNNFELNKRTQELADTHTKYALAKAFLDMHEVCNKAQQEVERLHGVILGMLSELDQDNNLYKNDELELLLMKEKL